MYTVWLGRFFGFVFVFFLVTPGWLSPARASKMVTGAPLLFIVVTGASGFIAFIWFIKRRFGLFVVEKFFFLFVAYMVLRNCIALTTADFSKVVPGALANYSLSCVMRYVLFLILLVYYNLLFTTNYNRKSFFNSVYVSGIFFSIVFMVLGVKALTGYVLFTKPPLLLIVFCVFSSLMSSGLGYFACFFQAANVILFSLNYCKRASFFLGVFSIVIFVCCFLKKILETRKLLVKRIMIVFSCLFILCTVFQVQKWSYSGIKLRTGGDISAVVSSRKRMNKHYCELYLNRNLCDKVFGRGDRVENGYAHNVYIAILLSGGLVGLILWSSAFVWIAVLFFKFHGKCFLDFVLWSTLGIYLLQSCYIGFFLYPTVIYFIVYYMECRYRDVCSFGESS